MELIYNTIPDQRKILPVNNPFHEKDAKKILFVGRFDEQKGLDFLLKSLDFQKYNVELVIIGASVLNNSNIIPSVANVTFLGWVDNEYIDSYMSLCDAVIVPSRWEGFGLVALEAMKNDKMVIASDAGGLSEIVVNNYSGLIFKSNSPEKLNQAIEKFSSMKQQKIELMGSVGKEILDSKFNFGELCLRLMRVYTQGNFRKQKFNTISSEKYD